MNKKYLLLMAVIVWSGVCLAAAPANADGAVDAASLSSLGPTEVYATADDGTPLRWAVFSPTGEGKHPAVIVIPGGGFIVARMDTGIGGTARDLAAAGFIAFVVEYRLAPPGHIAGQKSAGRFPDQNNDIHLAVRAARHDPRSNGRVVGVGGSAGAYHVAWAAATGRPGDDQLDAGAALSCAYDFTDAKSLEGREGLKKKLINFAGSDDRAKLRAASPRFAVTAKTAPLFLLVSENEAAPARQMLAMVAALRDAGLTNFRQLTLPGDRHSFAYWPTVRDQVITFLQAVVPRAGVP